MCQVLYFLAQRFKSDKYTVFSVRFDNMAYFSPWLTLLRVPLIQMVWLPAAGAVTWSMHCTTHRF